MYAPGLILLSTATRSGLTLTHVQFCRWWSERSAAVCKSNFNNWKFSNTPNIMEQIAHDVSVSIPTNSQAWWDCCICVFALSSPGMNKDSDSVFQLLHKRKNLSSLQNWYRLYYCRSQPRHLRFSYNTPSRDVISISSCIRNRADTNRIENVGFCNSIRNNVVVEKSGKFPIHRQPSHYAVGSTTQGSLKAPASLPRFPSRLVTVNVALVASASGLSSASSGMVYLPFIATELCRFLCSGWDEFATARTPVPSWAFCVGACYVYWMSILVSKLSWCWMRWCWWLRVQLPKWTRINPVAIIHTVNPVIRYPVAQYGNLSVLPYRGVAITVPPFCRCGVFVSSASTPAVTGGGCVCNITGKHAGVLRRRLLPRFSLIPAGIVFFCFRTFSGPVQCAFRARLLEGCGVLGGSRNFVPSLIWMSAGLAINRSGHAYLATW